MKADTTFENWWKRVCENVSEEKQTEWLPVAQAAWIAAREYGEIGLRDKLAAAALSAIYQHHSLRTDHAATLAYEQADDMLKARGVVDA